LALLWHAWIGMRDIWMDYVKPAGLRLALEVLTVLVLVGCAAWLFEVLWGAGRGTAPCASSLVPSSVPAPPPCARRSSSPSRACRSPFCRRFFRRVRILSP